MNRKLIFTVLLLYITLFVPLSLFGQDFEINGTTLVKYRGNAANVTIPAGVTFISHYTAFFMCKNLTTVTVSRKATTGKDAFPDRARIIYSD